MSPLAIKIKPQINNHRKFLVEMDFDKLERLASGLGFFSPEFINSLNLAEKNIKSGKVKKIKSLKELRGK